jgi:hypothetical protein
VGAPRRLAEGSAGRDDRSRGRDRLREDDGDGSSGGASTWRAGEVLVSGRDVRGGVSTSSGARSASCCRTPSCSGTIATNITLGRDLSRSRLARSSGRSPQRTRRSCRGGSTGVRARQQPLDRAAPASPSRVPSRTTRIVLDEATSSVDAVVRDPDVLARLLLPHRDRDRAQLSRSSGRASSSSTGRVREIGTRRSCSPGTGSARVSTAQYSGAPTSGP